jgi:acylphosphatase
MQVKWVRIMADVHHAEIHFEGHVQGVGFRYAAFEVAREFDVSGYVENLPDGRVRIEAEGDERELEAFAAAVEERMRHFIRRTNRSVHVRVPQFTGFSIK